ncbi:MAG: FAD/NAD(P)-binding oxidoreductase [Tenericutes bacterium HGW-Tenericutes-3]|nr:MAG: FAD/NAD(P)-binding oxidoreductase [Tenericutes bacterium HGW-Tenericutes-3]
MYDYIIIGSGIVGTTIARELSQYKVKVLVLEKENDAANHQTVANSAIIHSGHDPKSNTLKARLCVEGNKLYETMEHELNIPLLKTGAFVLAHDKIEEDMLDVLYHRAIENGVTELLFLNRDEAIKQEPNLADNVTKVLSLPSTKVTYPWEVAFACLENAIHNGVEFNKNSKVTNITKHDGFFEVEVNDKKIIQTKSVISAAGVFSDQIAYMLDKNVPYQIFPRKGEYFVLDRKAKGFVTHVMYPLPTEKGKGVLIIPQVHGNMLLGPTSNVQIEKDLVSNTKEGLNQIKDDLHALVKNIPFHLVIRTFAGIRASSSYEDFFIQESETYKNFYHVAGIDSPGLTAAPAIAKYLVNEVIQNKLVKKENYDPIRPKKTVFYSLDFEEQLKLIKKDPKYGNLVCKCEKITEAEIINAIHGPLGNDTIKGIKKRARAGSGLCQGGYCEEMVLKIIARETNQPINKINYYSQDTPILVQETKVKP